MVLRLTALRQPAQAPAAPVRLPSAFRGRLHELIPFPAECVAPTARLCYAQAMNYRKTAIERAFELARTGKFATAAEIKRTVSGEGYVVSQIEGPSLMRQLREIIRLARNPTGS